MTTHVFIVDDRTFKYHLEYGFAGTGAKDKNVDFNSTGQTTYKYQAENGLVSMMADCARVRNNDFIIFYLQQTLEHEGMFYGIFQADGEAFLEPQGEYLENELQKKLTFRVRIKPYEVYEQGVTEWQALDEIRNISAPCQMLWSLIYRKLKGNRGNTMITLYEADRMFQLIRRGNHRLEGTFFSYKDTKIISIQTGSSYSGNQQTFNILPRLKAKFERDLSHEAHLQMYIVQNLAKGINNSLDDVLDTRDSNRIEWIGNEVSCGVGMQRIDIMFSKQNGPHYREIHPIELKAVHSSVENVKQISRYIDWIEQYYCSNMPSEIHPVLICRGSNEKLSDDIIQSFRSFNFKNATRCSPLKYIEYFIENEQLKFQIKTY